MSAKAILSASVSAPPAVYVEDVFSTFLYTGNGSTQTITNGMDLSGKGGMVWIKSRAVSNNLVSDTARGNNATIRTNTIELQTVFSNNFGIQHNSNGFTVQGENNQLDGRNNNGTNYCSWTFRKQPKFFDVVTYTGNGTGQRAIAHNLGSTPGCVIVKRTDSNGPWGVWHRGNGVNAVTYFELNSTATGSTNASYTAFTSATTFTVDGLGAASTSLNTNGATYVAYLFAHDAGGFGDAGTDSVSACGTYTGNGSATGPTVTLNWEPQWLLIKRTDSGDAWQLIDNMRGFVVGGTDAELNPNVNSAESTGTFVTPLATGFQLNTTDAGYNASGGTYIYIAIRRGPMKTPTVGTEVFYPLARTGTGSNTSVTGASFPPDAHWSSIRTSDNGFQKMFFDKLRGANKYLIPLSTAAEGTSTNILNSFDQDGVTYGAANNANGSSTNYINWMFRRAPGFFDVVCWTYDGGAVVSHSLGVIPQLIIYKVRNDNDPGDWRVWSPVTALNVATLQLYTSGASASGAPTASATTFNIANVSVGAPNVFYLFATCPGVSKVGTYTGTGTTLNVDCGFTAGARFVLIKRRDSTGDWYVWDTARGIISGNDPSLLLNSTAAEVTNTDYIDPLSSGFQISSTAPAAINASGGTYIFLAIS